MTLSPGFLTIWQHVLAAVDGAFPSIDSSALLASYAKGVLHMLDCTLLHLVLAGYTCSQERTHSAEPAVSGAGLLHAMHGACRKPTAYILLKVQPEPARHGMDE
jgi:hypothetical protein